MRHKCNQPEWSHCCICDGRIHEEGCKARMSQDRDCCPEPHKMLHDRGQTRGIGDSSFIMWTPTHPYGVHRTDVRE